MFKKIWEFIWGKKLVVHKLKKYLRKLYEGYPSHYFYGYEKIEGIEEGIKHLIEDGIIKGVESHTIYKRSSIKTKYGGIVLEPVIEQKYRLTAEGLRLVELWNTERLTLLILLLSLTQLLILIN
ncbi:MAG: hypothetical protein ABIH25_01100 [Candidatus Woesearchaeota archaeon]